MNGTCDLIKNLENARRSRMPLTAIKEAWGHNLCRFCPFIVMLVLWQLAARFSGWSSQVFPGPAAVATGMWELMKDGTLARHTVESLFRVTVGFYLANRIGASGLYALGVIWPTLLGTLAWTSGLWKLRRGDVV